MTSAKAEVISLFDPAIIRRATLDSFAKLNPATLMRNPVIFFTEVVALMVSVVGVEDAVNAKPLAFPSPSRCGCG